MLKSIILDTILLKLLHPLKKNLKHPKVKSFLKRSLFSRLWLFGKYFAFFNQST